MTNDIIEIAKQAGAELVHNGMLFRTHDQLTKFAELIQARAWQPIETAPKDGSPIFTYSSHGYHVAWWDIVDGGGHPENGPAVYWWGSDTTEFIDGKYDMPTHWMPLPTPPAAQKGSV